MTRHGIRKKEIRKAKVRKPTRATRTETTPPNTQEREGKNRIEKGVQEDDTQAKEGSREGIR